MDSKMSGNLIFNGMAYCKCYFKLHMTHPIRLLSYFMRRLHVAVGKSGIQTQTLLTCLYIFSCSKAHCHTFFGSNPPLKSTLLPSHSSTCPPILLSSIWTIHLLGFNVIQWWRWIINYLHPSIPSSVSPFILPLSYPPIPSTRWTVALLKHHAVMDKYLRGFAWK